MSHHHQHYARGIASQGASRKRAWDYAQYKPTTAPSTAYAAHRAVAANPPDSSNWLLAGYLAHEFLTNGTLLGHKLEPDQADAVAMAAVPLVMERERLPKPEAESKIGAEPGQEKKARQSYADVASVLKTDGTHVRGVVNPTQLARWIQM